MKREPYYCDLLDFDAETAAKVEAFTAAAGKALGGGAIVIKLNRFPGRDGCCELYATAAKPQP